MRYQFVISYFLLSLPFLHSYKLEDPLWKARHEAPGSIRSLRDAALIESPKLDARSRIINWRDNSVNPATEMDPEDRRVIE